jgi:hypothetical protein
MKGLKFSKTGWLILAAGIFIVVVAGMGITRSGQLKDQNRLGTDLLLSQTRLDKIETTSQTQINELNQQLVDSGQQLAEAKDRLRQKIESVDVADKFYEIAKYYSVNVTIMGTTMIAKESYQGVPCSVISLSGSASGKLTNIIEFIVGLNNNFSTGFVQSAQIRVADDATSSESAASISLVVYSYEGS